MFCDFFMTLSLMNYVNVSSKSNKQKNKKSTIFCWRLQDPVSGS
jgi:hypothetical protein